MSFSLEQFETVLGVQDAIGKTYILIGGQAVFFWASRYAIQESALEKLRPFTSADNDFFGRRDDVLRFAQCLDKLPKFPPPVAMTTLAGIIPIKIDGADTFIEIVREVYGVKSVDVSKLAVEYEFNEKKIRVLDPVSLLICKTNLALTVNQKQRRDIEHLKILVICVRAFLRETLRGVEAEELPARGWLGAVERVLKLAESSIGKKAAKTFFIHWREALPEKEIQQSPHLLIASFRQKRFPQWLAKQK